MERLSRFYYPVTAAVLIAVILAAYANSFQAPFTFDDLDNFVNRSSMKLTHLSAETLQRTVQDNLHRNRVLPNISFALNYYFNRQNVWGYHLFNVVIHILNALVLYALFVKILTLSNARKTGTFPVAEISFIAVLFWSLHPLQTNGVTYLVQRMTSMAALFYCAALLAYLSGRTVRGPFYRRFLLFSVSALCWIAALMCKEISVMLPCMILACEVYFFRDSAKKVISRKMMFGSVLFLLLFSGISFFYTNGNLFEHIARAYSMRDFTLFERLLTQSRVIFLYLSLIILPLPSRLNLNYDFILSRSLFAPPQTLFALVGIFLLCFLVVYLFKRQRLLSFGLFWFLSNLLLESTVLPLELVYEHRLYLPSTMLILAIVGSVYTVFAARRGLLRIGCLVLTVLLFGGTWQRNTVWATSISLWQDVVAKSPGLERPYGHLSSAYLDAKMFQEAYDICRKAVANNLQSVHIYNNWGKAAVKLGKVDEGVMLLETAVQLDSSNFESHYNLGVAYGLQGRNAEARKAMIRGMQLMKR